VPADPAASLSPAQRRSLETVLELLAAERASVSSVTDDRAWKVHVEDSLTGLDVPELREAARIADVGAGAGFPGLVLAVALPDAQVDLVESISRKTAFITSAAEAASIPNAIALTTRAEDLARTESRESYDVVTFRAVARLSTIAELASPLLKEGGVMVAWKGKRDSEEEAELERASGELAMTPERILDVGHRAGSEHRHLHVVRKSAPTPAGLPRKPGMAKKRPRGAQ
jgi:16S rRNA (guanine527-N7)-methyltransferase